MPRPLFSVLFIATLCLTTQANAVESTCFGTVAQGRLENGIQLPRQGNNFSAYSQLGVQFGRTYVHSRVAEIVLAAYTKIQHSAPGKSFVYGETGWAAGGRFKPHRTHQNGLSVDFFVPVINARYQSVPLPMGFSNKFGYNIEFDANGKFEKYTIDFVSMAEHLYQLDKAAKAHHAGIKQVIFERDYLPALFATQHGKYLKRHIHFMKGKPWVRHDEHYHVDFAVNCKQMQESPKP